MKPRTQVFAAIGLLILLFSITRLTSPKRNPEPARVFPAAINRDCAPWDGAAFTVSFQYDPITTITISIWQSPSFAFPVTFSFPDESMRVGIAYSLAELDPLEELTGTITLQRVKEGIPVEGRFNFVTAAGRIFAGMFMAQWGNEVVFCG